MIRVVESDRIIIQKHSLSLLEGYPMLSDLLAALGLISFEAQVIHMYIVHNRDDTVNGFLGQMLLGMS